MEREVDEATIADLLQAKSLVRHAKWICAMLIDNDVLDLQFLSIADKIDEAIENERS